MLGFAPGMTGAIADWPQITGYFRQLDAKSDRVEIQDIGETANGRQMIAVVISSADTIKNLKHFGEMQRKLAYPQPVQGPLVSDQLISEGKIVVAVLCSLNPTEMMASQMSMQLAYELATARDAETTRILENTILILLPSGSPDGLDVIANWNRTTRGTSYEGSMPPEFSYSNAGQDMDQDWFSLNLNETRSIANLLWREWSPQIIYDMREQRSTDSMFQVEQPYEAVVSNVLPGQTGAETEIATMLAGTMRADVSNAGNEKKPLGDLKSAIYHHNALGIVTRTRSVEGRSKTGDVMRTNMKAARDLLSIAATGREKYMRCTYELRRANVSSASYWPLAYVILPGQGRDDAVAQLMTSLHGQGIEIHRLEKELHVDMREGRHSMMSVRAMLEMPVGSYVMFLKQPYNSLLRTLFEPQKYSSAGIENNSYLEPGAAYWTLPATMGVEVIAIPGIVEPYAWRRLTSVNNLNEVFKSLGLVYAENSLTNFPNPISPSVRIGVYQSWVGSSDRRGAQNALTKFSIPYETVFDEDVRNGNLDIPYDVIILPSLSTRQIVFGHAAGNYPAQYTGGITEEGIKQLRAFVLNGGTLICFDESTEFAINHLNLPVTITTSVKPFLKVPTVGQVIPIEVNRKHSVGQTLRNDIRYYATALRVFTMDELESAHVIARYELNQKSRGGNSKEENNISNPVAVADVPLGKGRVILFGFSPTYDRQASATLPLLFRAIATIPTRQ
jgi:hypothetical protein